MRLLRLARTSNRIFCLLSIHHTPYIRYIGKNKRHKQRHIEHRTERKLTAATVVYGK